MKFDRNDKATWPDDTQDVQVWSSDFGFSHAVFDPDIAAFGNWFDRDGEDEDSGYLPVTGTVHWWPLPDVTGD